ncbi:hypothetical protein GOODEAATRI_031972, partial [Goodea atripinnis]
DCPLEWTNFLTELAQMKALLQSLRGDGDRSESSPPEQTGSSHCEDDVISVAASGTLFQEAFPELGSRTSGSGSGAACLLDGHNGLFPPWPFPARALMHGRALAAMHEATKFGLGCMPPVESAIASLIIPPDEALRTNARCPRPQCRVTDDLLCRAYDSGARMGRIGNSHSHLMLGLSSSLESVPLDQSTQGLLDAILQAFALMTRELGRTLSTLVHARRQVWLAQSSLTEPCRRTLRV